MVKVVIHLKGEGLQDRDHSIFDKEDVSDPFFKVEWKGEEVARSEILKNNLNPAWAPVEFELELPADFDAANDMFVIKIKDEDKGLDDTLGEFTLAYPIKKQTISEGVRKEGLVHVLNNNGKLPKEKCFGCFGKKTKATDKKVKDKSEEKVKEKSESKKSSKHSEKSESKKSVKEESEKSEKKEEKKEEAKADEQVAVAAE